MMLSALVAALDEARVAGEFVPISGLAHDSRRVAPGDAFVALRGERADGHAFLGQALAGGARALVVDERFAAAHALPGQAATVVVPDTRRALSRLAAAFYDYPARALAIAGITGTNGKTTTTYLVEEILAEAGVAAGRIGTLGAAFSGVAWPLENTTPLALEVQALLAAMRDRGARMVVMEVSSHALALARVADVPFRVGVLTNVSRDHLDFHGSLDAYAAAKRTLFDAAEEAVLNLDDAYGRRFADELRAEGRRPRTYGFGPEAEVRATEVAALPGGSTFAVDGRRFTLPLPGRFNVHNALAALSVARLLGIDDALSAAAFARFAGVPGRMERFSAGGIEVLVDYAHTPDALAAVLGAARDLGAGRLAVVFGCGGDRDRGKRPEMGRVASEFADLLVVTSDNPRGEDPAAIVAGILRGVGGAARVVVEPDRRAAIAAAVRQAQPGDVVVVAGKGHETYQITGARTSRFDDREEVRAALAGREPVPT